ncbi:unnamed protein product [Rotaria sp. Silwood2]|nr:unnamed protein product [Rotaria sp. Silwood2]
MINKSNDIETTLLLVKMDWDKNDHGEYAHVDISEYIFKPTSTSSDKEETQVEKMTTINQTKQLADVNLVLDNYVIEKDKTLKYDQLEKLDEILHEFFICICSTTSRNSMSQMTNTGLSSNYSAYNSTNNQGAQKTLNTENLAASMDYMNSSSQHIRFQNIHPDHPMPIVSNSMVSSYYPQKPTNLSSTSSIMPQVMSSRHLLDPNPMMTSHLSVPLYSAKGSQSVPSSFHPMNNLIPLIDPSLGPQQEEHMNFSSTVNNNNDMKPPPHYPMYLNDDQPPPYS